MAQLKQKLPFILAASDHGPMILNRLDWRKLSDTHNEFGVGTDILFHGHAGIELISLTGGMILQRRETYGTNILALDIGANLGTFTLEWAKMMEGWGRVLAFEPQEFIYYALAGNIALNNLFNVRAFNKAVGSFYGSIDLPRVDYQIPGQFGGLSLGGDGSDIGQQTKEHTSVDITNIDFLMLPRVDFIKIDVEGMEPAVLEGAKDTIERDKPYMLIEHHLCGRPAIDNFLTPLGYETVHAGLNLVCGLKGDPILQRVHKLIQDSAAA